MTTLASGTRYDTGLKIRGLDVLATAPHHYRHYTQFQLALPEVFTTEVFEDGEFLDIPRWAIGFTRPDGVKHRIYTSYKSREEAEQARETFEGAKTARLFTGLEVWVKDGEIKSSVGVFAREARFAPLEITLTEEEAKLCLAFREKADTEWFGGNPGWVEAEDRHTDAVARAAALDDIRAPLFEQLTECLECGATYDSPGHVEPGGMGCERCNS